MSFLTQTDNLQSCFVLAQRLTYGQQVSELNIQ